MISERNLEVEVCDDDLNADLQDQVDPKKNNDHQDIFEYRESIYLSASELFNLRRDVCKNKGKDEDVDVYKGPKLYVPRDIAQEEETLNGIFQNHRKSLQLQRGVKLRDCMKAEWNEELKVAIVANLKGKTTQHMGHTYKGKVALSPEEALYLLEKNCIEIKHNNMPMSVEEAYAVMLKGKLGLEKYQVYAHLSQQGFLVVQHRSRVGSKYGEINARKRKAVNGSIEEPGTKRLTFTGVLASNSKEGVVNTEGSTLSNECEIFNINESLNRSDTLNLNKEGSTLSKECEIFNINDSLNKSELVPGDALNLNDIDKVPSNVSNTNQKVDSISIVDNAVSPDTTNQVDTVDFVEKDSLQCPIISGDTDMDHSANKVDEAENVIDMQVISLENENRISMEVDNSSTEMLQTENEKQISTEINNTCAEVSQVENEKQDSTVVNNTCIEVLQTESEEQNLAANNSCVEMLQKVNEQDMSDKKLNNDDTIENNNRNITVDKEDVTGDIENEVDDKKDETAENINGTEVDIINDDTDDVIIEGEHRIEKINVDDSLSSEYENDEYDVSDGSMPVVCEESSEDLDVLSCSVMSDEQNSFEDYLHSVSSDMFVGRTKAHDDDVTLVEVKKKESMPLAVIDLLSDEEEEAGRNDKETFEGSDDEIQVVKVCSGQKSNVPSFSRNLNSVKAECKVERSIIKGAADIKSDFRPQMKFPETFRKEVLCVPRPLVTLLPNHVRPAKELYVINHKKSQSNKVRVWESFRDIQDYQRDKRLQRGLDNSNVNRPFPSLRDYRFHSEPQPQRMNSFNREDHHMDPNFDRNHQNFPFQQNRDPFNSPPVPLRHPGSSLLPSPEVFNSPNHMPFMNVPNIHNLSSSNPALLVNEIQRTVQSVTSSILSSMLGQHLNHMNPAARSSPTFNEAPMMSQHHFNNFAASSPLIPEHTPFNQMRSDFHPMGIPDDPMFSGERGPYGMNRETPYENNFWAQNNFRQRNVERKGPMFPRAYRDVHRKRCWGDIKAAAKTSNEKESDSGSDIEEVPINLNQLLWSNEIQPLVKPGSKLPVSEVLQKLRITQMANLLDVNRNNDRYLPNPPGLELSFDVYLPGFKYKKTAPGVPKHRIVVLRSVDPIPKYSDIVVLQRKFHDGSMLQMAVVDHGDISFYSFNSVGLPDFIPHEN